MANLADDKARMQKSLDNLRDELNSIRAGRANPHVLDKVMVNYYGADTPLQQVANVTVPEPRMIQIQPWEPSLLKDIEKAIMISDVGINPTNDGKVIRLVFPDLTEEHRKELAKDIKKKGEDAKVAIRNIRRDANDQLKKALKASEISEDEEKDQEDEVQKMTDEFIKKIDSMIDDKSKEIMTV
ncbi:MAG: ribosome recycling factor [Lachnospiraceae bacterium]|jgi:ribosome recycling factor|nr:ribosome recycling factor [Lachnospiraceae bacterium]MDD6147659.1 ribosome recycling factor [Lachnospiraceae bacterium]MDY5704957.1 ribosome recycling factor [Lachnospiraceae bacterium]